MSSPDGSSFSKVYDGAGNILRFAADAEQHCEDQDPALFVAIRYNSTISETIPFGTLTPATTLSIVPPAHGLVGGAGIACGGGQAVCSVIFTEPADATLIATPDPGYTFTGWTGACHGHE